MRQLGLIVITVLMALMSCNNNGTSGDRQVRNDAVADFNGGVTLKLEDASLIQVDSNPGYNTAEWNIVIKNPGRYDVWLSSLTCDTLHLLFADNVTITSGDTRLTKKPVGDEIITDDKSVKEPWYRADSHMGSILFQEPGEYQVQVISDRLIPHKSDSSDLTTDKHTLINSLILKPM